MPTKLSDIPIAKTGARTHQNGSNIYLGKDTPLYRFGKPIGTLGTIMAGERCDCPHGNKHSDGAGTDYAITTQLAGGEVGIHCEGAGCVGIRYLPDNELTQEQKEEWAKQQDAPPVIDTPAKKSFDDFLKEMSDPLLLAIPKDLKVIDGTEGRFFHGGMHLVHGISKAGKTYFTLDTLNRAKGVRVIWVDGDQNDLKMVKKFPNIIHLAPLNADLYLNTWLQSGVDFGNVVFVIDSLKDFRNNNEMDSNTGMDTIIKRFKHFTKLGATVIVIHHSTPIFEKQKMTGVKLKGNAEAVYSNTDITYLYERNWEKKESRLTCERSRVEEMPTGKVQVVNALGVATKNNNDPMGG